jgi:GNAT superfamily N-acetyltransferase
VPERPRPLVRRAVAADADAIARVHHDGWQVGYRGIVPAHELEPLTLDHYREQWRALLADPESPRTFVADVDGEVVGVAGYAPSTQEGADPAEIAELTVLYVHSERQRAGAGRALLAEVTEAMRGDGFERAELWVFAANERGRAFYEAVGWEEEGSVGEWRGAAAVRYRTAL